MSERRDFDVIVVGAGIVGLATAKALVERGVRRLLVIEAERHVAAHQTGHNSGVIHSGLYYAPGSLKARLCRTGGEAMYAFCAEHGIPHERCGKIVVATSADELPALDELERRGRANGLAGLVRLDGAGTRRLEPHVNALAALHVPEAGITDFVAVARALAGVIAGAGGVVRLGDPVRGGRPSGDGAIVETARARFSCGHFVNCGGLQADRIARRWGAEPDVRIVPFRGEYDELTREGAALVRHLVYPVPDPRFPFLGVHLTRLIDGRVVAGPNAVLALARHGYRRRDFSLRDVLEMARYGGAWRLARRHWRTGLGEVHRIVNRAASLRLLRRLVPELRAEHLRRGSTGVRAQAVDRAGRLVDDFRILRDGAAVHVLNAPSPAATASLAIGGYIAAEVLGGVGVE